MLLIDKSYEEWAELSGLEPKTFYSLADHALAAYRAAYPDAEHMMSSE